VALIIVWCHFINPNLHVSYTFFYRLSNEIHFPSIPDNQESAVHFSALKMRGRRFSETLTSINHVCIFTSDHNLHVAARTSESLGKQTEFLCISPCGLSRFVNLEYKNTDSTLLGHGITSSGNIGWKSVRQHKVYFGVP
jgi:hypothetical protein